MLRMQWMRYHPGDRAWGAEEHILCVPEDEGTGIAIWDMLTGDRGCRSDGNREESDDGRDRGAEERVDKLRVVGYVESHQTNEKGSKSDSKIL